jgi:hypothetical protein
MAASGSIRIDHTYTIQITASSINVDAKYISVIRDRSRPENLVPKFPKNTERYQKLPRLCRNSAHYTIRDVLVHGGRVRHRVANEADYPIHADALNSHALARSATKFGTNLFAHAYPKATLRVASRMRCLRN